MGAMPELSSIPVGGFHDTSVLSLRESAVCTMSFGHDIVGGIESGGTRQI